MRLEKRSRRSESVSPSTAPPAPGSPRSPAPHRTSRCRGERGGRRRRRASAGRTAPRTWRTDPSPTAPGRTSRSAAAGTGAPSTGSTSARCRGSSPRGLGPGPGGERSPPSPTQGDPALSLPQHPTAVGPSPCHLPRFGDPPPCTTPNPLGAGQPARSCAHPQAAGVVAVTPQAAPCSGGCPQPHPPIQPHPISQGKWDFKESCFFLPISLLAPCLQHPWVTPAPRSKGSASPRATRGEGRFILATSPVLEQRSGL